MSYVSEVNKKKNLVKNNKKPHVSKVTKKGFTKQHNDLFTYQ